jgi:hypothetical protein
VWIGFSIGTTDIWETQCLFDPLAQILGDVDDVEKHIPGAISCIREWFRMYKTATGNEPNTYGLDGKCMGKDYALKAIDETHKFWKKLRDEKKDIIHTPLPTNQRKFENFWNSYDGVNSISGSSGFIVRCGDALLLITAGHNLLF